MKINFKNIIFIIVLGTVLEGCSNADEYVTNDITTPVESDVIFSETFLESLGDFTQKSIVGDQIWAFDTRGFASMSGYVGTTNYADEDWLISPEIDLANETAAYFSVDYVAHLLGNYSTDATIWITDSYDASKIPGDATWTKLNVNIIPDPGNYVFTNTGGISLNDYKGKKIRIAIKYLSTAKAGTLEIKNFIVMRGNPIADNSAVYSEPFSSSLGQFTVQNVVGDTTWICDPRGYATMTGYINSSYQVSEDWLISPEIDLTNLTAANFSFDYVTRYFGNLTTDPTVWISEDYSSGLPNTATWTQVATNPFVDLGSYTFTNSQQISLTNYIGKKVHIAFKYISSAIKAGTWEIKNFVVNKGEAKGGENYPFTTTNAINSQTGVATWVEGYVVGYAWPFKSQFAYYFTPDSCTQMTNIILSDSLSNLYTSKCLSVQLPRGSIRNSLNLKSNKGTYNKKIKILGTLSTNCGIAGLVNPTKCVLPDGNTITSSTTNYFSETFATSLGNFTINNVKGNYTWRWISSYASMSGYGSGTNYENEDWLISPTIDLTQLTSAALSFNHTINKGVVANMTTEQTLWITKDDGLTWNQLIIPVYPVGNNWTFVNSGEINLDNYAGSQIKIAFKYTCTSSSSATWEIKNFLIFY